MIIDLPYPIGSIAYIFEKQIEKVLIGELYDSPNRYTNKYAIKTVWIIKAVTVVSYNIDEVEIEVTFEYGDGYIYDDDDAHFFRIYRKSTFDENNMPWSYKDNTYLYHSRQFAESKLKELQKISDEEFEIEKQTLKEEIEKENAKIAEKSKKHFDIWREGYRVTGEIGKADFLGVGFGINFKDACIEYATRDESFLNCFREDELTWWGCRLFDNAHDAMKSFG